MKSRKLQHEALALATALTLVAGRSWAQSAPAASAPPPTSVEEETVVLSPFIVEAAEDQGSYQAKATLAGSRVRTELKDIGSAISVVTPEFLRDTGATNNETLLQYTTNTEVGGVFGNFAGLGNNKTLDDTTQRMAPHQDTRVRGLGQADNTRDFFLTDIPWDAYNVGRVDMQRGPNAILFGIGKPAGIINSSINGASFKQGGQLEARFGSYGSARGTIDWNQVIREDELAVRFDALDDNTKYRQKPAYNRDERVFGALRFDPKFLQRGDAHTTLNIKYENGKIRANRPRILPPGDLITPWWTDPSLAAIRQAGGMNPLTLGQSDGATIARLRAAGDLGAGVRGSNAAYYNQSIGSFGRNYGGIVADFSSPTSGDSQLIMVDVPKTVSSVVTLPWTIMSGVIARKDLEGVLKNKANYDFYRDETLQDPTIFDFYNKLLDGPNKAEWSNHEAFNASLSQTFFSNKLGFEGVVDKQNYDRGQVNLLSEFGQAITLDMNNHFVDGSVNPNYGKACSISDQYANNSYRSDRDSARLTAFGELRASDYMGENFVSRLLGRHVVTALASNETYKNETRGWIRYAADSTWGAQVLAGDMGISSRAVNTLNYLTTSSIAGLTSLSGAGIQNLQAVQIPHSGNIHVFDMTWKDATISPTAPWTDPYGTVSTQAKNTANYVGWGTASSPSTRGIQLISDAAGDRNSLTNNASLTKTETTSYAGNWQGYLWDGVFVPSVGLRQDTQKSFALLQGDLPRVANTGSSLVDLTSPDYKLPDVADNEVTGHTTSWSFVLHTPQAIRDKLPGRTDLTLFYNRSSNFQPAAGRIDVVGDFLPSPEGKTKDYGFMITTLDDRLTFKVSKYDTHVSNDALDSFGGAYMIYDSEAWAYDFARGNLLRANVGGWADFRNGYIPVGTAPEGGWSAAQIAASQAAGDAICNAYMATRPSNAWFDLYNIPIAQADQGNFIWGSQPSGFTITGDTRSKGTEYELTAQPTKSWNIMVNAAKTTAVRENMAQSLVDWVEDRWAVYNTPVTLNGTQVGVIGDVRFWNGNYDANESLLGKFTREFMSGYYLYRIQENSDVPELRPWRFNVVSNYSFSNGKLHGINVGGGYRWQDGVVVGYPVLPGASITDPRAFDLSHPYKGPSESSVDVWVGYTRKLGEKVTWHVQLNVRNAFASNDLIPVTVQPDGSMAVGRIPEPRTWTIANTFQF